MHRWFKPYHWWEVQELLMIHESAFYWPGCTQLSIPPGFVQWVGGTPSLGGMSLRPSPRVFKEMGPTRGLPSANWRVTHTCYACWWQVWHFSHKAGGSSLSGSAVHSSGVGTWAGENLRVARGNSQALPRALNLGAIAAGQGATMVGL